MKITFVKTPWWKRLFHKKDYPWPEWIPPKLSQESLERIAIAIMQVEDERGLKMPLPISYVVQPWVMAQMPKGIH